MDDAALLKWLRERDVASEVLRDKFLDTAW
jgi:hypothetical protein